MFNTQNHSKVRNRNELWKMEGAYTWKVRFHNGLVVTQSENDRRPRNNRIQWKKIYGVAVIYMEPVSIGFIPFSLEVPEQGSPFWERDIILELCSGRVKECKLVIGFMYKGKRIEKRVNVFTGAINDYNFG